MVLCAKRKKFDFFYFLNYNKYRKTKHTGVNMIIKPCPKCGRMPKITECMRRKNGNYYYMIGCPNYCGIFFKDHYFNPWISYESPNICDDNFLYKKWNKGVENYIGKHNKRG